MRFIHTSDWHLGRFFFGVHLTDDQEYLLKEQFIPLIKDTNPDLLLISGDIYDRAVPPLESVALLDEVLYKIIAELKVPVVIISGNHDSGERLAFASRFLSEQKLFVFGEFNPEINPVTISDSYGAINIYPLPYTEPITVRDAFDSRNITDHNSAVSEMLNSIKRKHPAAHRAIVMAHVFTIGGETCESERPLSSSSVGGIDTVNASLFNGFNYTALGHLHRAQTIGNSTVRYSGSLMKYSFSEANHIKSVEIVDVDRDGNCTSEQIALAPKRDLKQISGFLNDILNNENRHDDYLEVTLLDELALLNPMEKLREKFPNVLKIERPMLVRADTKFANNPDYKKSTISELFNCFFKEVENKYLSFEQKTVFEEILNNIKKNNQ